MEVQRILWAEKKRLYIELKKQWKHFIFVMVITRRNHQYDHFNEFLFESKDALINDVRPTANGTNRIFCLNLPKDWFLNADMDCNQEFAIVNMETNQPNFWRAMIKKFEETKRAIRLV
jgi:hypothetical protein